MVHGSERIKLSLFKTLNGSKIICLRRAAILEVMVDQNTHAALIVQFLKIMNNIIGSITLEITQTGSLYSEIKNSK